MSDGKTVHVEVDKEITKRYPTLALLPIRSEEEEINNNGQTWGRNSIVSVRKSNRIYKPLERLGSVPYF